MRVRRHENRFVVQAPAKLNLFLEVLARRADGYHEIETLLVAIDRYDTLALEACDEPTIALDCRWATGLPGDGQLGTLPTAQENLVVKAVARLRERAEVSCGARISLVKRIPAAAGLGGASSDAAAALVAADAAWNLGWPRERLAEVAAEIGSDVPFFLRGGAAIARGRGERLEAVERFPALHFVVIRPPVGLSTPAVYRACAPATEPRNLSPLLLAAERGDVVGIARAMHNQLQFAARNLTPWIDRLANVFAAADVLGHQMSGSGSSYFALCRDRRQARRIASRAAGLFAEGLVFAASSEREAEEFEQGAAGARGIAVA